MLSSHASLLIILIPRSLQDAEATAGEFSSAADPASFNEPAHKQSESYQNSSENLSAKGDSSSGDNASLLSADDRVSHFTMPCQSSDTDSQPETFMRKSIVSTTSSAESESAAPLNRKNSIIEASEANLKRLQSMDAHEISLVSSFPSVLLFVVYEAMHEFSFSFLYWCCAQGFSVCHWWCACIWMKFSFVLSISVIRIVIKCENCIGNVLSSEKSGDFLCCQLGLGPFLALCRRRFWQYFPLAPVYPPPLFFPTPA